jgi:Cu(I)/Ag(I) efflux system membrane fusion protein
MGLPDTSPVPKRDSMGMDYLQVYEGDQNDAGSITVSPGKQQRCGVRTTTVTVSPLARVVRAPGIVALDERRISVIALRADAFINQVNDVTTGFPGPRWCGGFRSLASRSFTSSLKTALTLIGPEAGCWNT